MKKVLLLNSTFEFNTFITEMRALKLLFNHRAEALSYWEEYVNTVSNSYKIPAVMRLYYPIKRIVHKNTHSYNRKMIMVRDKNICQYCGKILLVKEVTIDHVIPKSQGGSNTFINCVVCCTSCNYKKGNQTPAQAGMNLIKPVINQNIATMYVPVENWHPDWHFYIN